MTPNGLPDHQEQLHDLVAAFLQASWAGVLASLQALLTHGPIDDADNALLHYDWSANLLPLRAALEPLLAAVYRDAALAAGLRLGAQWGLQDPRAQQYARERGAELISSITATTRAGVRSLVQIALEAGGSQRDLTAQIAALPGFQSVFGEYRAEMIARTELGFATNQGTLAAYRDAGIAHARCLDTPVCGLRSHDDPEKPNGKVYPLSVAQAWPLSHPNCVRVWNSVEDSEIPDVPTQMQGALA